MTQLSIPAHCTENWSDMTPNQRDCRHCAVCEKQIIDFTKKTDAEILAYLQEGQGKICGRFKEEQLNRPIRATTSNRSTNARRGGLTAAAASVATLLTAQQPLENHVATPITTEQNQIAREIMSSPKVYNNLQEQDSMRTIAGKVVDAEFEKGLVGVSIILKNTRYGAMTDMDGVFTFEVPLKFVQNDSPAIQISYPGYVVTEISLSDHVRTENVGIFYSLQPDFSITACLAENLSGTLGMVTVLVSEDKPTFSQRIGRFFKGLLPKKKKYVMGCPSF